MDLSEYSYTQVDQRHPIHTSAGHFWVYRKRDYRIDWSTDPEYSLIKSRWSGFAINLAAFIHGSTDITILTILTNLKTVSVYSVYGLVSNGIKALVQACLSGLSQTVGQAYAKRTGKS